MIELLSETKPTARKEHLDNAYQIILSSADYTEMNTEERDAIKAMENNSGMIQSGQKYIRQNCCDSGELWTYKALPELDDICRKYDLFEG